MNAEIESLKQIGLAGLSFFVIRELLRMVWYFVKQKKVSPELEAKETSREKIHDTHSEVKELHKTMKQIQANTAPLKEMSDVILAKDGGQFIVYNPRLHESLNKLNGSIERLIDKIKP